MKEINELLSEVQENDEKRHKLREEFDSEVPVVYSELCIDWKLVNQEVEQGLTDLPSLQKIGETQLQKM